MAAVMTQDAPGVSGSNAPPQWGIFKDGQPVIKGTGVSYFEYKKDWNLPDFKQEKGAFESYDKVELPYDVSFKFIAGKSVADRRALLESVEAIQAGLDLYDAVTPEKTYASSNVAHIDYTRSLDGGLGVIAVEVWLKEIRVGAAPAFSATKAPQAAGTQSGGTVQTTDPTTGQTQTVQLHGASGSW